MAFLDDFLQREEKKLLLISPWGAGDIVMSIPLFWAIRRKVGDNAHIGIVAQKRAVDFANCLTEKVDGHRLVDQVHAYNRDKGIDGILSLGEQLRDVGYTSSVDLGNVLKNALIALASRARYRLGPSFGDSRDAKSTWLLSNNHVPTLSAMHKVERLLEIGKYMGTEIYDEPCFKVGFTDDAKRISGFRRQWLAERSPGKKLVGMPLGAGFMYKTWHAQNYARLGQELAARGYHIVLFGSPKDYSLGEYVMNNIAGDYKSSFTNLVGRTSFPADLLIAQGFYCFIGADTGLMHGVAAIMDVPTISLFGPTNDARYLPWHKNCEDSLVVRADSMDCYPTGELRRCSRKGRGCGSACMENITPEMVITSFEEGFEGRK